jgi:hypothetical protein
MEQPNLTTEQKAHLDTHLAGIGHNLGPKLEQQAEAVQEQVSQHSKLRAEATKIRVMFDMMRSHLSGEYLLPETTSAYVFGGLALVATMTGLAVVAQPIPVLLLDSVVVSFTIAAIHGDIQQYVIWRSARDPSYDPIKRELCGD